MCLDKKGADICPEHYLFVLTDGKPRKQQRQWLLFCEAGELCGPGAFLKLCWRLCAQFPESPLKRIISGNDQWHCQIWLMATSQY